MAQTFIFVVIKRYTNTLSSGVGLGVGLGAAIIGIIAIFLAISAIIHILTGLELK